jgi:hypothetical protein
MIRNTAAVCVRSRAVFAFLVGSLLLAHDIQSDAQSSLPVLSLFGPTDMPANVNWNDSRSAELGVEFQSTALGKVRGIRFYKGPLNTGPHVGRLWSADGTLLSEATFSDETDSGWQEADFIDPITLVPGATYIASYHTNGFYAATNNYFNSAHVNAPLTAPASADTGGGNGVYSYGPIGDFPSATYEASNYWVDVAFILSTASLFNPTDTPANVTWNDPSAVELGVRFESTVAGFVTGVRFYKGPQNTGAHVGNLWSSDGVLLASATFTGETNSGWQVAAFTNPVPIAADTIYIVSYHTNGFYSADPGYFTSYPHSNGPLVAPAGETNGVFSYGATSSFPSSGAGGINYWVDLIFTLQPPGGP